MTLLAFKLVVTPLLLLAATLAIRRWGETAGGFVVGLPLTSGPISLFLALEHGSAFAAQAASGSLIATAAQAAFGLVYCGLAAHGWPLALAGAGSAFLGVASLLSLPQWPTTVLFAIAVAAMAVAIRWSPSASIERRPLPSPWWDLPARMVLIVGLVLAVTLFAPTIGPRFSGVIASFPFMGAILAVFAQRGIGPGGAQQVLRGMTAGLFGFALFFYVLGWALSHVTLAAAYATALAAALVAQGVSLRRLQRASPPRVEPPLTE